MAPLPTKNKVNRLDWNIPITNPNGTPTDEFMRKWLQQATQNGGVANLSTAAGVSAVLDLISAVKGSLLVRGATVWGALTPPPDATMFLNGAATPAFAKVKDTDLSMTAASAVNDVTITTHGFAPILPNDATKFLNGAGAYTVPASGGGAGSAMDDGTNFYIAMLDGAGQLILDVFGDPIWALEVLPLAAVTGVTGRTNGAAVAAGQVGERIKVEVLAGAAVVLATGVAATVMSLTLTPGLWDCRGMGINLPGAGCNQTVLVFAITLNAGDNPATAVGYQGALFYNALPGTNLTLAGSLAGFQANVTVNTTLYLRVISNFTVASQGAYGFLDAVRIA